MQNESLVCMTLWYTSTDTTDVQSVHARPVENSILLQCEFITGTDAQGCSVVLLGRKEIDNVTFTMNITKTDASSTLTILERLINSTYLFSCYQSVHGFDIESDGLVGALAVPGELLSAYNASLLSDPCSLNTATENHPSRKLITLIMHK